MKPYRTKRSICARKTHTRCACALLRLLLLLLIIPTAAASIIPASSWRGCKIFGCTSAVEVARCLINLWPTHIYSTCRTCRVCLSNGCTRLRMRSLGYFRGNWYFAAVYARPHYIDKREMIISITVQILITHGRNDSARDEIRWICTLQHARPCWRNLFARKFARREFLSRLNSLLRGRRRRRKRISNELQQLAAPTKVSGARSNWANARMIRAGQQTKMVIKMKKVRRAQRAPFLMFHFAIGLGNWRKLLRSDCLINLNTKLES